MRRSGCAGAFGGTQQGLCMEILSYEPVGPFAPGGVGRGQGGVERGVGTGQGPTEQGWLGWRLMPPVLQDEAESALCKSGPSGNPRTMKDPVRDLNFYGVIPHSPDPLDLEYMGGSEKLSPLTTHSSGLTEQGLQLLPVQR